MHAEPVPQYGSQTVGVCNDRLGRVELMQEGRNETLTQFTNSLVTALTNIRQGSGMRAKRDAAVTVARAYWAGFRRENEDVASCRVGCCWLRGHSPSGKQPGNL